MTLRFLDEGHPIEFRIDEEGIVVTSNLPQAYRRILEQALGDFLESSMEYFPSSEAKGAWLARFLSADILSHGTSSGETRNPSDTD